MLDSEEKAFRAGGIAYVMHLLASVEGASPATMTDPFLLWALAGRNTESMVEALVWKLTVSNPQMDSDKIARIGANALRALKTEPERS